MGCYMSSPDTRVYVTEGAGKNFKYATASCQGWRREQEDAEECLPYFDENASLFILCDGHGGAEVAKYTVAHFPNFLKNHPLYKAGEYESALDKAFIEFDALLRTDEVGEELHKLAFQTDDDERAAKHLDKEGKVKNLAEDVREPSSFAGPSSSNNGSKMTDEFADDVDSETLRREAQLPLQVLLNEHFRDRIPEADRTLEVSNLQGVEPKQEDKNGEISTSKQVSEDNNPIPSSSKSNDIESNQGPSTSSVENSIKEKIIKRVIQHYFPDEDSSDDSEYDMSRDVGVEGDDEDDDSGGGGASTSRKLRRKKLKRRNPPSVSSSDDDNEDAAEDVGDEDDDDDDSDEDEDDSDDDEGDDDDDDDENEDEDYAGDEEEDDDDDDDEDEWEDVEDEGKPGSRAHKPGTDSGCTVVVALIKDNRLYVASAGDSRCIIILRNGECLPLTFDHKPEDVREQIRIMAAGGRVTEGRVNGGLNLSRAFGDFTYKNIDLEAKNQMITPLPDLNAEYLNPHEVEYIFLACDGIWNSKSNDQTARFIRKIAKRNGNDLIDICIQLFRSCLAPQTDGDGTGCDNMTCIIARFEDPSPESSPNSDLKPELKESDAIATSSNKRSTTDDSNEKPTTKRRCLRL